MLLIGKVFDDRGNRMTPSYAIKKGVRYRYYVSCVLAQGRKEEAGSASRVPAMEIEKIILGAIRSHIGANSKEQKSATDSDLVAACVDRVVVHPRKIEITLSGESQDDDVQAATPRCFNIPWAGPVMHPRREVLKAQGSTDASSGRPMRSQHRTRLILAIANARRWLTDVLEANLSLEAIAVRENCSERHVRMTLSLAFIAPDIIQAAVSGRLPVGLGITRLAELPMSWEDQRRQIGI